MVSTSVSSGVFWKQPPTFVDAALLKRSNRRLCFLRPHQSRLGSDRWNPSLSAYLQVYGFSPVPLSLFLTLLTYWYSDVLAIPLAPSMSGLRKSPHSCLGSTLFQTQSLREKYSPTPTGFSVKPRNEGGEEELLLMKDQSIQKAFLPSQSTSLLFTQGSLSGLILSFGRLSCTQVYQ